MTSTLAVKLDFYTKNSNKTGWHLAIYQAFEQQKVSREHLKELINECLNQPLDTKQKHWTFFQKCLALIFLYQSHFLTPSLMKEDLRSLFLRLKSFKFPEENHLFSIYRKLIVFFLDEKKESFNIYFTDEELLFVEYGNSDPEDHLPHYIKNAEIGILTALFGLITNQSDLVRIAVKIANAQKKFLDLDCNFFSGIWVKEEDYLPSSLSFINSLFFWLVSLYSPEDGFEEIHQKLSKTFSMNCSEDIASFSVFYPLLYLHLQNGALLHFIPLLNESKTDLNQESKSLSNHSGLGFGFYEYGNFTCVCSASGVGSGFASLRKNSIEIVSVGPQFLPIGQMNRYGLYRTPLKAKNSFKDIRIEKTESAFYFDGWTRILDDRSEERRPGRSWMHINFFVEKDIASLGVKWINLTQNPDLYLVFFIKAKKVIIDKTYHLQPYTLDRYEGKAASLVFQNGKDNLTISSDSGDKMQIIPLSGGDNFWGAEFLVAYHFPKDSLISFKII